MNAKTRYRQREKLRAALVKVLEALVRNGRAGIMPDPTTARLAVAVLRKLSLFAILATRKGLAELLGHPEDRTDLSQVRPILLRRKKETAARLGRKRKAQRKKAD